MKIQSIEKFLTERERTEEEIKIAKETEDLYSQLYFLSLQDINEKWYYKVKKLQNDYTYLDNLFADILPTNILLDTQMKVIWALGEIYGKDYLENIILPTKDQSLIKDEYTKREVINMIPDSVYTKTASGGISFIPQKIEKEKYRKPVIIPEKYNNPQEYWRRLLSNQSETLLKDEFGEESNQNVIVELNKSIDYEKLDEEVLVLKEALSNSVRMSFDTTIKILDVIYKVDKGFATKYVIYLNEGKEKEITYEEFVEIYGIGEMKRKLNI